MFLALLPLLMFMSCGQRTVTTTYTNPQTGQMTQQTTTTDDYGASQNYQVYNGPNGQQMVVTNINGQQMYVPYNVFQSQMQVGGYGALNDYYYSNPSYFHPYSASSFLAGYVLSSALSGTYGGYYNHYHINSYRSYHYQHTPYYRQASYGRSSNYSKPSYSRPSSNYSGMRSSNSYTPRTSSSGMRSSGNSGSMRSSGGGMRSSSGGMRSSGRH